jgi:hypothetical protein
MSSAYHIKNPTSHEWLAPHGTVEHYVMVMLRHTVKMYSWEACNPQVYDDWGIITPAPRALLEMCRNWHYPKFYYNLGTVPMSDRHTDKECQENMTSCVHWFIQWQATGWFWAALRAISSVSLPLLPRALYTFALLWELLYTAWYTKTVTTSFWMLLHLHFFHSSYYFIGFRHTFTFLCEMLHNPWYMKTVTASLGCFVSSFISLLFNTILYIFTERQ